MKISIHKKQRDRGFVLLLVIILAGCSLLILAGVMSRTSTVSLLNLRSTQMNELDSAAEAACEKAYAKMSWDFSSYGPGVVTNNLSSYRALIPTSGDNPYWGNFSFTDPVAGTTNALYVAYVTNYTGSLPTQFTNQFAYNSPIYRLACNTTANGSLVNVVGCAQEDVLLALVPITTYAIFYNGELEFTGCATMTVNGRVHSNADICVGAGGGSTLTFNNLVTCVQTLSAPPRAIWNTYSQWDPSTWATTFNSGYTTNYQTISIAIQMTNTHSIIDIPPAGEDPMSQQGQIRLYNQSQMVVIVSNSPWGGSPEVLWTMQTAYNGSLPGADNSKNLYTLTNCTETYLNTNQILPLPFLTLNDTFVDLRQGNSTQFVTDIDINQYRLWLSTNSRVTGGSGKFNGSALPTILYVADRRNTGTSKQAVVRLYNGAQLPPNTIGSINLGFSVATPNPLYVWGNYNTTTDGTHFSTGLGATTNGYTVPAAVLSDALTLLSPSWQDADSSLGNSYRQVNADMTFNAAIVTGNVPTTGTGNTQFSGGVHNITRLLEDWSNNNLTMNTSIVVLYASTMATNQWKIPYNSSSSGYYNPPTRLWGFDTTYYSPNHQPPGVPCALLPIRFNWYRPPPGSVVSAY
ncbi:MAG TPA: hypothetical protein VK742_20755 [Candidatus Sulfotelmatobacter sp.]|jgi:hypothetical protein|nr:hypothetical protein [Candidatus Sulfotelmatobacter sp.]